MNRGLSRGFSAPVRSGLVHLESRDILVSTAKVSFERIPQNYFALQFRIVGRSDAAANQGDITVVFNRDVSAIYDQQLLVVSGGTLSAFNAINTAGINGGALSGGTSGANYFGHIVANMVGYSSQVAYKTWTSLCFYPRAAGSTNSFNLPYRGHWRSAEPVWQVDLTLSAGNWAPGSMIDMYGVPL